MRRRPICETNSAERAQFLQGNSFQKPKKIQRGIEFPKENLSLPEDFISRQMSITFFFNSDKLQSSVLCSGFPEFAESSCSCVAQFQSTSNQIITFVPTHTAAQEHFFIPQQLGFPIVSICAHLLFRVFLRWNWPLTLKM